MNMSLVRPSLHGHHDIRRVLHIVIGQIEVHALNLAQEGVEGLGKIDLSRQA